MLTIFVSPYYHEGSEQKRGQSNDSDERVESAALSRTDSEQSEAPRVSPDTEKNPPDGQVS